MSNPISTATTRTVLDQATDHGTQAVRGSTGSEYVFLEPFGSGDDRVIRMQVMPRVPSRNGDEMEFFFQNGAPVASSVVRRQNPGMVVDHFAHPAHSIGLQYLQRLIPSTIVKLDGASR